MGRYVPPEVEGTTSFNTASGKGHALGARARKLKSEGILIVRFELPFSVWCAHCKPEQIIGQGVRFNAEKKKVGNYYSTPIWSFRFKHTACGGWIEVRTDPQNTAYIVTEGGKRRDTGEGRLAEGEIVIGASEAEKERLEKEGAFGSLEKKVEDKRAAANEKTRIEGLLKRNDRDWEDPYEKSKRLRAHFRDGRNLRKAESERAEILKDKLSLGIDLSEEREEDRIRAQMIDFGGDGAGIPRYEAMFPTHDAKETPPETRIKRGKKLSSADVFAAKKARLTSELLGNTKAAMDPFSTATEANPWQPSIKRKKPGENISEQKVVSHSAVLVDYDSD